jgi:predicted small lipoprotein YifL
MLRLSRSELVNRLPRRLAVITVVLALPLALAACGVKGPLEPPPSAKVVDAPPEAPRQRVTGPALIGQPRVVQPTATQRAAASSPAAGRASPLDWLVD